ncbi:MAG: glycosyl hydrolase [Gammaproteobacteria bacterium]|nr:glycosyl hydrolase [Gammaproteobacteria bacterium]
MLYPLLAWTLCVLLLVWSFRKVITAAWREPVLKFPVLVIESDDWGPGPALHAQALERLRQVLLRHRDSRGRPALMTLGVILALPDTAAIRAARMERYHRLPLTDARFEPIRRAMAQGIADGVFAVQLHGLEHYSPAVLMNAAHTDPAVAQWLATGTLPETETLPSHLQSRWTDASRLPSVPLRDVDIARAVAEETALFKDIFGIPPVVAVPPAFVWGETVERAWAAHGVRVVVTPGRRYEGRGADGRPDRAGRDLRNGERGSAGMLYLVRDAYFEPALDHKAERVTAALAHNTELGRPTLVETHRFNFVRAGAAEALAELGRALDSALAAYPSIRFLAPVELAEAMTRRAPDLIEAGFKARLRAWLARLRILPRFWKLARVTGLALPLRLAGRLVGATARLHGRELCP